MARFRHLAVPGAGGDFPKLLAAQFCAQAADGMMQAALANELLLEPMGGAPLRALGVFALTLLPYSVISPFLGVFVDRWPRRGVLVWANVARAAVLVAGSFALAGRPDDLVLYALALVLLGLGRLWLTTKGAVLPVVLGEHDLLRGNAVSGGGGMISALAGGVAGLGVVALGSTSVALGMAGLLLGASALISSRLSAPMAHPHPHLRGLKAEVTRIAGELTEGLRAVTGRARVRLPLAGIFLLRTVGMLVTLAAILIIKQEFPAAAGRTGRLATGALAVGSAGLGAFVGVLGAPAAGRRLNKPGMVLLGFAISGAGLVSLGGVRSLGAVLGLAFVAGLGAFIAKIAVDAQVQEELPDALRGRAFALYDILYNLASIAAAIVLVALDRLSAQAILALTGVGTFVVALGLGAAMRRAGIDLRPRPA
jgi:MFS family permease